MCLSKPNSTFFKVIHKNTALSELKLIFDIYTKLHRKKQKNVTDTKEKNKSIETELEGNG